MERKRLRAYLSGGMEYAKGEGSDWRKEMQEWIKANLGHSVFNPNEASKSFLARQRISHRKYRELKSTDIARYTKIVNKVVHLDSHEVALKSDYVICYWNRSAALGAGTKGEVTLAKFFGKPVYMVTKMKKSRIPGWVLGCTTEIFTSFNALRSFLQKVYK